MRTSRSRRTPAVLAGVGVAVLASATAVYAAGLSPDGTTLRADLAGGGQASLELEDRNVEPVVCFVYESGAPQEGDGFTSRVVDRAGQTVIPLGTADQWVDGAGRGCEVPRGEGWREVFADPGQYVVVVDVVEEQGSPATADLRSGPLRAATS